MDRNIKLFYIYIFFLKFDLWFAVVPLFFLDKGFNLTQFTLAGSIWYISNLLFEVPAGSLADRLGKKVSMLVALLSLSLSLFILAFSQSFFHVFTAYVLWGFSASFETGTYTAFLYDSLKSSRKEGDFRKVMGRVSALTIIAAALGSIASGYLGSVDLSLPIKINASIPLLLSPFLLFFREPKVANVREPTYLLHIKKSVRYISGHKLVACLVLYTSILGAGVWALHSFYQPLLDSFGVPVERIGVLYSTFRLAGAAGAYLADPFYGAVGKISVYLVPLFLVSSVLSISWLTTPWIVAVFIFLNFFISGIYPPILSALLNENLPSGKRATIISFRSLLHSLFSSSINPALGRVADLFSLSMAFRSAGVGIFLSMSLIVVMLRKELKRGP